MSKIFVLLALVASVVVGSIPAGAQRGGVYEDVEPYDGVVVVGTLDGFPVIVVDGVSAQVFSEHETFGVGDNVATEAGQTLRVGRVHSTAPVDPANVNFLLGQNFGITPIETKGDARIVRRGPDGFTHAVLTDGNGLTVIEPVTTFRDVDGQSYARDMKSGFDWNLVDATHDVRSVEGFATLVSVDSVNGLYQIATSTETLTATPDGPDTTTGEAMTTVDGRTFVLRHNDLLAHGDNGSDSVTAVCRHADPEDNAMIVTYWPAVNADEMNNHVRNVQVAHTDPTEPLLLNRTEAPLWASVIEATGENLAYANGTYTIVGETCVLPEVDLTTDDVTDDTVTLIPPTLISVADAPTVNAPDNSLPFTG